MPLGMRLLLLLLLTVSCGRIGFDALRPGIDAGPNIDATIDASASDRDAAANLQSRVLAGAGRNNVSDIVTDSIGNIFLTGYFQGEIDFGEGVVVATGDRDSYVASYDSNLQLRWVQTWSSGATFRTEGNALALDGNDRIWLTGDFHNTIDFGAGTLISAGGSDIFLALFTTGDGALLKATHYGGSGDDDGTSLAVDSASNVTLGGEIRGAADFGGGPLAHMGTSTIVVASFDSAANHRWSKRYGDVRFNIGRAISVDNNDNIYLSGLYEGNPDFGSGPSPYRGIQDAFILSLGQGGNYRWSTTWGSGGFDFAEASINDSAGNVYISGYVSGVADVPGGPNIGGAGQRDAYLLSYTSSGVFRWAKSYGGTGCDRGRGLAIAPNGEIYQTGHFTGNVNFDSTPLVANADRDAFVVRTTDQGAHLSALGLGADNDDHGKALAISDTGQVYLVVTQNEVATACNTATPSGGEVLITKIN